MNNTILRIAASIDPGQERDYQEDNYSIGADLEAGDWKLPSGDITPGSKGTLLVVADGMGGLNAGEVASKIVVESIQAYFDPSRLSSTTANPGKVLVEGILYANGEILKHAKKNPDTEGMGTTVVLAWILDGALHVAWSGDSRCYLLRQGQRIYQVNHDHSYVQELIDQQQITSEEPFYHPNKNIITQSLGDVGRQPAPGYETTPLQAGDRILLCSDGLNTMLHDAEIESFLGAGSVNDAARSLVKAANDAGGYDNITAVVAEVVDSAVAITAKPAYQQPVAVAPMPRSAPEPQRSEPNKKESLRGIPSWLIGLLAAVALLLIVAIGLWVINPDKGKIEPPKQVETKPNGAGNKDSTNSTSATKDGEGLNKGQDKSPSGTKNQTRTNSHSTSTNSQPTTAPQLVVTKEDIESEMELQKKLKSVREKIDKINAKGECDEEMEKLKSGLERVKNIQQMTNLICGVDCPRFKQSLMFAGGVLCEGRSGQPAGQEKKN